MFKQDIPTALYHIDYLQNSSFRVISVINAVTCNHKVIGIRRKSLREILGGEFLGPNKWLNLVFIQYPVILIR